MRQPHHAGLHQQARRNLICSPVADGREPVVVGLRAPVYLKAKFLGWKRGSGSVCQLTQDPLTAKVLPGPAGQSAPRGGRLCTMAHKAALRTTWVGWSPLLLRYGYKEVGGQRRLTFSRSGSVWLGQYVM